MIGIFLWLAWIVFLLWLIRRIYTKWRQELFASPFDIFWFTEFMLLGNAVMRIYADEKTFYPRTPQGFLNTGHTEAQLLVTAALLVVWLYSGYIYYSNIRFAPVNLKWNYSCFGLITLLLGSAFACNMIFGK